MTPIVYESIALALGAVDFSAYRLIAVCGGSCSGKTFLAKLIAKKCKGSVISMDDYYKGLSKMNDDNFDCPNAVDLKLWHKHLKMAESGLIIKKPIYNFKSHERESMCRWKPLLPVVAEGLFVLLPSPKYKFSIKVFVEATSHTRLNRRIARDVSVRERSKEELIRRWRTSVEPMFRKHIIPQRRAAEIVVYND